MTRADGFEIRRDDLRGPEIARLLEAHLEHAATHSPRESIHALDLERLRAPGITFWSAWAGGELLGCGALRELAPDHGEIKSMHTARAHRGRGVASRLLAHILAEARARSYARVSLETGTMAGFAAARALYARFGFVACPPFAEYREDPNSVCMTLDLRGSPAHGRHCVGPAPVAGSTEAGEGKAMKPSIRVLGIHRVESAPGANAVLIEVCVDDADARFDVGDFGQAGSDQAPYDEQLLSDDGCRIIEEGPAMLTGAPLRYAFFFHEFDPAKPLTTSYGDVAVPPITGMPDRLRRLLRYEPVD